MHPSPSPLTPASAGPIADASHIFPWSLGEVRASLAVCPPGAFHITGLRLEQVAPHTWWGDLAGYREDLGAAFVWPGFRIRRGRGWEISLPPYLVDLDGAWRACVSGATQRLVVAGLADPRTLLGEPVFIAVERPSGLPVAGDSGGERVVPAEHSAATWPRLGKRYRFAAQLTRHQTTLVLGAGFGARMLARMARHVMAVDVSPERLAHAAHVFRAPRLTFAAIEPGRLPFATASFDIVVALEDREPNVAVLLPEIDRVLRPDGILVLGIEDAATLPRLTAGLTERFAQARAWSQRRTQGLAELLDEYELEPGLADDADAFIVLARRQPVVMPTDDRQERLREGAVLLAADRLREAFTVFAEILRAEPTCVGALVGTAHCALAIDDTRAARELLRRVLAVDPEHAGARAALRELDETGVEVNA